MNLEYYVYRHNFNDKRIEKFNIFNHSRFFEDVKKDLKMCEGKEEFAEKLRKNLAYYFWSKAEHEVIITSWVPHITMSELNRLNAECEKTLREYNREPYSLYVNLDVGEKIDIYEQVRLNWDLFVNYVWLHKKRKSCCYCNDDYNQEISATVYRFHTSSNMTQTAIDIKYCPNCGRKLN